MKALSTKKQNQLNKMFHDSFSFRTASMGNFFNVEISDENNISSSSINVWPFEKSGIDGYYGSGTTYSRSSNQKAKHVYFTLHLKKTYHFEIIGGIFTIFRGKYNRNKCTPAIYFEQSKGFELKKVSGYIYKDYHICAKNVAEAILKIEKIRSAAACKLIRARLIKNFDLKKVWVSFEDSIKAGNCIPGTDNFAKKIGVDLNKVGAVRADYILEKARDLNVLRFAERAINHAKLRRLEKLPMQFAR